MHDLSSFKCAWKLTALKYVLAHKSGISKSYKVKTIGSIPRDRKDRQ